MIGQKKELLERKIGENKSKIDWSLVVNYNWAGNYHSIMLYNDIAVSVSI